MGTSSSSSSDDRGNDGDGAAAAAPRDQDEFFSLSNLQRRVAATVDQAQTTPKQQQTKLSVAIAGGGATFLSTLAATPGASSTLLEGTVTYSRQSFRDFVQQNGGMNNKKKDGVSVNDSSFKFCSAPAAQLLADAALQRTTRLTTLAGVEEQQDWSSVLLQPVMGLACTSALQSVQTRQSFQTKGSRAYCCAQQTSTSVELYAHLAKASLSERTRVDEDVFVAHCLLTCWECLVNANEKSAQEEQAQSLLQIPGAEEITQVQVVQQQQHGVTTTVSMEGMTSMGDELRLTVRSNPLPTLLNADDALRRAAERILSGSDEAVLLLPTFKEDDDDDNNDDAATQYSFQAVNTARLPPNSLVVPGSFNPPHVGHLALARAATQAMESNHQNCNGVWFELSITNADKPALQVEAVVERLRQFLTLPETDLPDDVTWGLLLTDAPLFAQKVDLLAPLQIVGSDSDDNDRSSDTLHFCIGTDTLVRLIDPKYYSNSQEEMLRVLDSMPCRFVVGGRLEQKKDASKAVFVTGQEDVEKLPEALQTKFIILPDFRVDISSTALRRKMAEEAKEKQQQQ